MSAPEEEIFNDFTKEHPDVKIKLSQYKEELPWNRKKAYRETCLDRIDLNFEWHREALKVAVDMLSPLHSAPTADAEGEAEAGAPQPDPLLQELATLAATTSKSAFANALVCSDCLGDNTKEACLDQICHCCSFGRIWSRGLRPKVIVTDTDTNTESVRNNASMLWEKQLSWDVVKSSDEGDDRNLRHTVTGTITELLDSCEDVFKGWMPHRYHAVQAREAEIECDQNLTPAKLRNNSDWSENGEIVLKLQMQSEYWSIKYYSLLVSITSFLVASAWKDRRRALDAKTEVTVQPVDAPEESICYVAGSYFAVVQEGSANIGPDVAYLVRRPDGSTEKVPRHRLRHRLWHHVAFLGVTNEKQHVATTTQTFFTRQLEFWRLWNDKGRDAAHAFAASDRASAPPPSSSDEAGETDAAAGEKDAAAAGETDAAAAVVGASSSGSFEVCATVAAEGSVSEYTSATVLSLRELIADRLGVGVGSVRVEATAGAGGGVSLSVVAAFSSEGAALAGQQTLEATLSSAAAASSFMSAPGVVVTATPEVAAAAPETETDAAAAANTNAVAANGAATATPPTAAAISAAAIALAIPKFGAFLAELNLEKFFAWLGHADNATHFKSSNNLHWWSNQLDMFAFIRSIWIQYGCPGKGKGPWDGLGAMVKSKVRRDITNERCLTASERIRSALEVAEHLRNLFSTPTWLSKHAHMKINEIVVFYIDKDETDASYPKFHWPTVEPKFSTFADISKKYCFLTRGRGRVAGRRYCCFCESCCLALEDDCNDAMRPLLDIPGCKRCHLSSFKGSEQTITCTAAAGVPLTSPAACLASPAARLASPATNITIHLHCRSR